MPRPRGRPERVSVPNRDLVELRLRWRVKAAGQRLLDLPPVRGITHTGSRPESFAAEVSMLHVLGVNDCVALIARIALDQARSRTARDIRTHQRQQRTGVLELRDNRRPQAGVPVANLPSESVHRIER